MIRASTSFGVVLLLASLPCGAFGQDRNQPLNVIRQHERVLTPVLEIREFSGEFERWTRAITDAAPKVEMFRWTTPVRGIRSATWSVMSGAPGTNSEVLQTGSAGPAPAPGSTRLFRIDFSRMGSTPSQTEAVTYWVVLEPIDASGRPGEPSQPVQITYTSPGELDGFIPVQTSEETSPKPTSKLGFLRDLLGENIDLPAQQASDLESTVNSETLPTAQIRLMPTAPVSIEVSPNAVPGPSRPHYLDFLGSIHVNNDMRGTPTGAALFRERGGVNMFLNLEPAAIYLLEIRVRAMDDLTLGLDSADWDCPVDFQRQRKHFVVTEGSEDSLLATVQRPPSVPADRLCVFRLNVTSHTYDPAEDYRLWDFLSAELTKLNSQ